MADQKYQTQLNSFIQKKTLGQSDFVTYIKMLNDLTKLLNKKNGYAVYAGVVKNWIIGFKKIFSEDKITQNGQSLLDAIISRFCPEITNIFFMLLQCFRQFESNYIQEFYLHWKTFLSRINGQKRAECFDTNARKFQIVIQNLRMATSRIEQFAILAVLRLYIECLPISELCRLIQHDNLEIVKGLARLMQNPTIFNQHEFLQKLNALGHCIESLKPHRIICKKMNIDMDNTNHEMWLDFNKTEKSVVFATVSKADCSKQSYGTARRVKLRGSVRDDHLLEIIGNWNVISAGNDQLTGEKIVFKFYFLDKAERLISNAIKHAFRSVNLGGGNGSLLQGLTDISDAQHAAADGSVQGSHRLGSLPSVIRPKLTTLPSKFSLPTPPKLSQDVGRYNSSLSLFYRARNELNEQDAELPTQLTYVIKPSITTDTFAGQSNSDDSNATYVLRESVNPIAAVQPENDNASQKSNCDIVDMDNESQSSELINAYGNLSSMSNRTYTIIDDGQSDATYLVDRLTYYESAFETNSKLLYRDDTLPGENDELNDLENENAYGGEAHAYSGKKIEILENIMIVPPYEPSQFATAEQESIESERCSPFMTNIPRTYLSQADERVSVKRVFNQYSQPATPREWLHVKISSIQSRNVVIIGTNKSRQSLQQSQQEVTSQEKNSDKRDDRLNRSLNQDDLLPNVSQKEAPQSQAESPCPSQYASFVPIVMSSQQASQDSQKERSMQSSQKTEYQNSKTLIGSCQDRESTEISQKMSSQNLSQREAATRRTKCIAIADLPKMSQPVGPITKSREEPKSSQKASTKASQKSSEETTSLSLQQRIKVPITDQHDKSSKMNRIESPETQTPSVSALPNKESGKELNAPPNLESTANSSQKRATTSHQQLILSASIISPGNDEVESPPSAKRVKCSESEFTSEQPSQATQIPETVPHETHPQNAIQEQRSFSEAQPFDDDSFMGVAQNPTENPESPTKSATKTFFQRKISSSDNSKVSAEITMPNGAAPRKLANNSAKSKRRLTNETSALLYRKNMTTVKANQPLNKVTKVEPRYSALNYAKPATHINQNNSENLRSNEGEKRDEYDDELAAIVEGSSNGKTTLNDYVPSDDISVDENGTVYDDKGCVFGNNDELQRAACFYIANDGLSFLKRDAVAMLPTRKRQRYERQLKTIQRMIDHGLERLHAKDVKPKKPKGIDPYALSHAETTIQGAKPKRRIKAVSVTMSRKTIGNKTKKITMTKSKLYYDNDVPTFSKRTKSKSKTENFFWKTKPHTASVTVSIGRTKSGSKKLPAVDDQSSSNFGFDQTVRPKEISLPIYASQKMIDSHVQKSAKRDPPAIPHRDKSPSINIDCLANSSANDPVLFNDGRPDQGLCSTATCASNMKELLDHLSGIEMKSGHDFQELCEQNKIVLKSFINGLNQDQSQRDHGNSNWQELLNRLLDSMESLCDTVCVQLQEQQQRDKEQTE